MHRIQLEGLASEYASGQTIATHAHDTNQIVHAISGVMRVLADNGTWVVPPGRALWVPARTTHEIYCNGAVRFRTVYLTGNHPSFPMVVQVGGVSPLMREIMVRVSEGALPHQLPHLTVLLIDEIASLRLDTFYLPLSNDARIATLCSSLLENPADTISLNGWADRLALSPRSLIRLIKKETGMSFRELRRQSRILASLERLPLGQSVTNVAIDVGFESPSAFIYAFRSVTGKTPSHFTN